MKTVSSSMSADLLKSPLLKIAAVTFVSITFFYLGKNWTSISSPPQLLFYSSPPQHEQKESVAISPNNHKSFHVPSIIAQSTPPLPSPPPPPPSPPPPPPAVKSFGIVNADGQMSNDFDVGDFDPDAGEVNETISSGDEEQRNRVKVSKFGICPLSMREYIPCLDNADAISKLKSTDKGEKFERHCPDQDKGFNCLVPVPKGYRQPIPWPRSRDEVWYYNVPHTRLVEDKGGQNWITKDKDKFKFPGGGTQFIHGADKYLDQISEMVPEIAFGRHTRVVLDVGCGVASFGAYLISRNVLPLSVAPKDVHENQIQFALERGVPAMVAAFATRRLLYPSQAFELIHCSRCRINWTRDDGILLLELNRILRAGGYFAWAAQPVYKHEKALEEQWEEMLNLTKRLCWTLVKKAGYVAIWQKSLNNSCYLSREPGTTPPLCDPNDDPDSVWYVDLKPCITRLPNDGYGANLTEWPARLHTAPDRLQTVKVESYIARKELFKAESKYWSEIIEGYVRAWHWKTLKLRNVLDMKASYGGFAAALVDQGFDCWVLNVVPVSGPNTLPVIYDRGLMGVMHDWCEPFDTYPRTYDLIHAASLFSVERKRCNMSTIMLEMDRILRPGGRVYIRDSLDVMDELEEIGNAMGWRVAVRDTSEGPHASYRIMTVDKPLPHT